MQNRAGVIRNVLLIIVVVGLGIASSQALFRDVEDSQKGVFVVGTLDLSLTGENGQAADSITVERIGEQKVTTGGKTWIIHNSGSLPGQLDFQIANINNYEYGCNEPENLVDTSCANPGLGTGELGQHVAVNISLQGTGKNISPVLGNLATGVENSYGAAWDQQVGKLVVPPGGDVRLTLSWNIDGANFGNEVQGDSVKFDTIFTLEQVYAQQ